MNISANHHNISDAKQTLLFGNYEVMEGYPTFNECPSTTIASRCKIPSYVLQKAVKRNTIHGISPSKRRHFTKQEKRTQGKERRIYSTCILINKNIFMYSSFICQPKAQYIEHQRLTRQQATDTSFFICQPYTKYIGTINSK